MRGPTRGTGAAGRLAALIATATMAALACNRTAPAPAPLGEILVVADTELSVPRLVNRLRIDLYSADGSSWYSSRDIDRSHASDWPASFAVQLDDGETDRVALVRLRAYTAGATRDYRGERFVVRTMGSRSLAVPSPATPFSTDCPLCPRYRGPPPERSDMTPATEPLPGMTVDRLLVVHVRPGVHAAVRTVLRGACLGTMADLHGVRTCVDTDGVLVPENEEATDPELGTPAPSQLLGSFEAQYAQGCASSPSSGTTAPDGTPLHDERVCVPGGVFQLGSWDSFGVGPADDVPQRLVAVPAFVMDKYEVTVGRWRAAVASGFRGPDASPTDNPQPLPSSNVAEGSTTAICSWSSTPRPAAERRDEYPLTCTTWTAAREFCRWRGGDLPSEVQWEYAATAHGAKGKTRYPWGGDDGALPSCARTAFGRGSNQTYDDFCNDAGATFGPLPVTAFDYDGGDRTPALGLDGGGFLVDLGGNAAEWTRDAVAAFSSDCWLGAPVVSPGCELTDAGAQVIRGGFWAANYLQVSASIRVPLADWRLSNETGWRCAYPGGG